MRNLDNNKKRNSDVYSLFGDYVGDGDELSGVCLQMDGVVPICTAYVWLTLQLTKHSQ